LDGAQVRNVLRADDVEPFRANEAQVRRVLLGLELIRQVLWDDRVVSHRTLHAHHLVYQRRTPCGNAVAAHMSDLSRTMRRLSGSHGVLRERLVCSTHMVTARRLQLRPAKRRVWLSRLARGAALAIAVVLLLPYLLVPLYRVLNPVSTLMLWRWAN